MKLEIPNCQRCCCCLPLRRGIITFGYLNLLITIFFGILQVLLWVMYYSDNDKKFHTVAMYRGVVIEAQMFLVIALYTLDIVFNIVLIVGAHMKSYKLMRVYYYYQLTMMIANFFVMLITYRDITKMSVFVAMSELSVAFLGFVLQIYLLLLIHSELNKQRYQEGRSSFVNQMVVVEPPRRQDERNFL